MVSRINLRRFESFRAVMLTGSATRGAAVLGLSQPAISRLLAEFEEQLQVMLFERRNGRLYPTREAEWLFRESKDTLECLDRLDQRLGDIRHISHGQLRVVATPPMAYGMIPAAMKLFRRAYPDVPVSIEITARREVRAWIDAQQFDLAVATLPLEYPGVEFETLARVAAVCVLPKGHRLCAKAAIGPDDFAGEPLISLLPETLSRYRMEGLFAQSDFAYRTAIETQTPSSICVYVAAGLGLAVTDPFTTSAFRSFDIEVRPFRPRFEMEFGVIYPVNPHPTKVMEAFLASLREAALQMESEFEAIG